MAADWWVTGRTTEVHATPVVDLGAEQLEVDVREHPGLRGLLWLDWRLGPRALVGINGSREQLRGLLQRSLDALDAYEQAQAGEEAGP